MSVVVSKKAKKVSDVGNCPLCGNKSVAKEKVYQLGIFYNYTIHRCVMNSCKYNVKLKG